MSSIKNSWRMYDTSHYHGWSSRHSSSRFSGLGRQMIFLILISINILSIAGLSILLKEK